MSPRLFDLVENPALRMLIKGPICLSINNIFMTVIMNKRQILLYSYSVSYIPGVCSLLKLMKGK